MTNKQNVVAIIPARGGSKGIPRKNVMDFCGIPLIAWSINQARASHSVSQVFVTTDDAEIAAVSEKFGASVIQRPPELATDKAATEPALVHALDVIEAKQRVDAVVFLQATSPLRMANDIDDAVATLSKEKFDSLFSAGVLDDFCIWIEDERGLSSLNFDYKNRGRRQDRKPCFVENGSVYVFKPEVLRKHGNRLGGKIGIYKMRQFQTYELDSPEEIEKLEYYMRRYIVPTK